VRRYTLEVAGRVHVVDVDEVAGNRFLVLTEGHEIEVRLKSAEDVAESVISPEIVPRTSVVGPAAIDTSPSARTDQQALDVAAPLPGSVVAVRVQAGTAVCRGQVLVDLEAMKMVSEVRSPRDGTVSEVHVQAGEGVRHGQRLVTLAADTA
jgi:biotin carboxyl carrier protein